MFEYKGVKFSAERVTEIAKSKGLTLEDFLNERPEIRKINEPDFQNPTAQGAVVEETVAPNNMELPSENISSGSQSPKRFNSGSNYSSSSAGYISKPDTTDPGNEEIANLLHSNAKDLIMDPQFLRNVMDDEFRGTERKKLFSENREDVFRAVKKHVEKNYNKDNINTTGQFYQFTGFGDDAIDVAGVNKSYLDKKIYDLIDKAYATEHAKTFQHEVKVTEERTADQKAKLETLKDLHIEEYTLPSRKNLVLAIDQSRELQGIINNKDSSAEEFVRATKELAILQPKIEAAKNKIVGFDEDTKFLFSNAHGKRIDTPTKNTVDLTAEFKEKKKELKKLAKTDFQKLEMGYFYHLQEYADNERSLDMTIDFKPNGGSKGFQHMHLDKLGYKENEDGSYSNVKIKDLMPYKDHEGVVFKHWNPKGESIVTADVRGTWDNYLEDASRLHLEKEAYGLTYLMNIDPGTRKKSAITTIGRFFESAVESTIGKENAEKIGTTTVKELDEIQKILGDANIPFSEQQQETFKKSFFLKSAENLGHFVPELAKFAIVNYATGGALSATGGARVLRALQQGTKMQRARYHMYMALMEEAKFEVVTGGEAKTGSGAGFYLGGAAFRKFIPFAFGGNMARYNEGLQKTIGGAGGMVAGSESALILESAIDHLQGNKEFMTAMEELYGDGDVMLERMGLSAVTGFAIGGTSLKSLDFKSIKAREQVVRDLQAENTKLERANILEVTDPFKIKENNQKIEDNLGKIFYLSKDIARANEAYSKLDLKQAQQKRNAAEQIITNPESTPKQIKDAKAIKAETTAQIESARNQVTSTMEALRKSKALGEFDFTIQEGKEGFSNKSNNAEFVSGTKGQKDKIIIDLLSYRKGLQSHEVTHLLMKQLFKSNPEVANKLKFHINELISAKLKDSKLPIGDKQTLEELVDISYKKKVRGEEYISNLVEILQNPTYKRLLVEGENNGLLSGIRENFMNMLVRNKIKTGKVQLEGDNIRTAQDLVNFLGKFGKNVEAGKDISKQIEGFKTLKIDGKTLYELGPPKKAPKSGTKASKEIVAENVRLEKDIVKTGKEVEKGVFKPTEAQSFDLLLNNLGLIGDMARKLSDPKRQEAFNIPKEKRLSYDALYNELYTIGDKISTQFKVGEKTAPFGAYFKQRLNERYPLAFKELKRGEAEGVRLDDTKLSETLTGEGGSGEVAKTLIDPVKEFKFDPKAYDTALGKIDLSKQNYTTLKDVAPKITDKIFGGDFTFKGIKKKHEFIKNNAETLFDLLPMAYRLKTEGTTKSSTKVNPGILGNFYVKAKAGQVTATGRADMTTGTKAGLAIQAKMPFDAKIPSGPNKGKKVGELFLELLTKESKPVDRNQVTIIKGLQAEIGRAITNSRSRAVEKQAGNRSKIIEILADGKSEVLASKDIVSQARAKEFYKNGKWNEAAFKRKYPADWKIIDKLSRLFAKGMEGIDNKVNFVKDFRAQTIKKFQEINLDNIQSNSYKQINAPKAKDFAKYSREIMEYLPTWMPKSLVQGLLTTHYRTNMEGISLAKVKERYVINKKGEKEFFTEVPEYANVYKESALGKKSEQFFPEGSFTKADLKSINVLKTAYKKSQEKYNEGKREEGDKILTDSYKKINNTVKTKLIEAYGDALNSWFKNSSNPKNLDLTPAQKKKNQLKAAEHIMLMMRNNTNIEHGLRGLVPISAVFTGTAKLKYTNKDGVLVNQKTKLEHANPMVDVALKIGRSIVEGKWESNKKEIISNYSGVVGPKGIFDKLDSSGGRTNPSGMARMLFSPQTLKMFKTVDSGLKKSLYDIYINAPKNHSGGQIKGEVLRQAREYLIKEFANVDAASRKMQKEVFASKDLNKEFNKHLEASTGIKKEAIFSDAMAAAKGAKAGKSFGDYFIPHGAEDFAGLLHKTLAKGKQGEKQLEFYEKNLYEPYNLAMENITREQVSLSNDFRAVKQQLSNVPKTLKETTEGGIFTKEHAVRVSIWNKLGYEIPGLSKAAKKELLKEVSKNPELNQFANEIIKITKGDGYAKPGESWVGSNIAMDFVSLLNGGKRTKHLEVWQKNVDTIFSKDNLNKLEAAYGKDWVKNVTKTLARMKTGSNRTWGGDATVQKWNEWVNGSVGAIMFLNTRSAVLQTISNINYINFKDNNPLQAAKAFGNQKQYWKDFIEIFNSDYLQNRRGGNKINVNESELALASQKGGAQGVIAMMLNKGFVFTRMADSFAIASGGSAMYRNRLNRYKKEGMSEKEAKEKAFLDFKAITEETQQSSRPDRISEQQAGNLGRFMLAFANTPMQYNRIIKRNAQDLFAGRGNAKEKISRITYYSTIQNLMFNALQKSLFALAFGEDKSSEEQISKYSEVGEGMVDSLLRGSGLAGNAAVAVKNVAKAVSNDKSVVEAALTISPPLYSKASKLRSANYSRRYITKNNMFEPSLDNPALNAGAQFSSAVFNLPLDRAIRKAQNIEAAMGENAEYWQKVALTLGWSEWNLDMDKEDKPITVNPRRTSKKKTSRRRTVRRR
jgi:hypothetical protein